MIKTNVEIAEQYEHEEAIAMGEYHEVEATEEEIREYAMYGCPDADMQFLF